MWSHGGVPPPADAGIAIIGGTGLYTLFDGATRSVSMTTPYGDPSGDIHVGTVGEHAVAFLPRHGPAHRYPAHRVPYRANMWALASLGVRRVLAPCAVGSLRRDLAPGELVVPDQLIDRTQGRDATFYDDSAVHVSFAEPYCPQLRALTLQTLRHGTRTTHDGGTMVVVSGPRFGTRAEAASHRHNGADIVNMTALPEAALARELALCYATLAVVTDYDAGIDGAAAVEQSVVFRRFAESLADVRSALLAVVAAMPVDRSCSCAEALDGLAAPDLGR